MQPNSIPSLNSYAKKCIQPHDYQMRFHTPQMLFLTFLVLVQIVKCSKPIISIPASKQSTRYLIECQSIK